MSKQILLLVILILISFTTKAQVNKGGLPSIKHFNSEEYSADAQNWAIVQDNRGIMYFGNNNGSVLQYDGKNWKSFTVNNKSVVRSLATDSNNIIYVGAVGEFGYIAPNKRGEMQYNCISCDLDSSQNFKDDVWKTYTTGKETYFCSGKNIYVVEDYKLSNIIELPEYSFFSFFIDNRLLVGNYPQGIFEYKNDSLSLIKGSENLKMKAITDVLSYNKNSYLIFTYSQGIYKYNFKTGESENFINNDSVNNLLSESSIYDAVLLDDGNYAIATLYNNTGILIIDKNGKIQNKISKPNGLKDDQITYLYQNKGPLWVATNSGGIYNINYNSVISVYDESLGLDGGGINSIINFEDRIYIATDGGVYYSNIENDEYKFKQVPEFNFQSWSLIKQETEGNVKLLVGTISGIFEIYNINKTQLIDDKIKNRKSKNKGETFNVRSIVQLKNKEHLVIAHAQGVSILEYKNNVWTELNRIKLELIGAIEEDNNANLWLATRTNGIYYAQNYLDSSKNESIKHYGKDKGLTSIDNITFLNNGNKIIFGTSDGIFNFDKSKDKFYKSKVFAKSINGNSKIFNLDIQNNKYWITLKDGELNKNWIEVHHLKDTVFKVDSIEFKQLPNTQGEISLYKSPDGVTYFGIKNKAYVYAGDKVSKTTNYFSFIRDVIVNDEESIYSGTNYKTEINGSDTIYYPVVEFNGDQVFELPFKSNNLEFKYSATFYEQDMDVEYSVFLDGNDDKWSKWSTQAFATRNNLDEGDYIFNVKSRNVYGEESNIAEFKFTIKAPWYRTIWAYILYVITIVYVIYMIVKLNSRRLVKEKEQLEEIVEERTAEIRHQKDEIEEIHQEITDSIHYAKRIQTAILPVEDHVTEGVPEHFILFKPKDIVSGDFHWASITKDKNGVVEKMVITAADCTGHGVPGAFMSMLGVSFLNEIVTDNSELESNEILNSMRASVIQSLQQTGAEGEQKDGMDLALIVADLKTLTLQYSGANNPLYILRHKDLPPVTINNNDNEIKTLQEDDSDFVLYEIKPDKMPIAIYLKMDSFTLNEISLQKGDSVYMFSDGYADQFGGPKGKKFKYKPFKRIFLQNQNVPLKEQKAILDQKMEEWKAYTNPYSNEDFEQIDDIVVIGIKF